MRGFFGATTASHAGTKVSCRDGVVRISSPRAFSTSSGRWCAFIERVLSVPDVVAVEIDRLRGTASIHYSPRQVCLDDLLEKLSAALAAPDDNASESSLSSFEGTLAGRARFRLTRR